MNLKRKFLSFDCEGCGRRQSQLIVPLFIFSASVHLRHDVHKSLPGCAEVQLRLCQRHRSVSEVHTLQLSSWGTTDWHAHSPVLSLGGHQKKFGLMFQPGSSRRAQNAERFVLRFAVRDEDSESPKAFSHCRFLLIPPRLL